MPHSLQKTVPQEVAGFEDLSMPLSLQYFSAGRYGQEWQNMIRNYKFKRLGVLAVYNECDIIL